MSAPPDAAPSAPPAIPYCGREALLGLLEADLAACGAGRGGLVLLGGEPGMGKTRTAEELVARAAAHGVSSVVARGSEVAGAPALWIWQQALRHLVDAEADALPARVRTLLDPGAEPKSGLDDAATERFLLFEDVIGLLSACARRRPRLVVLDDLHRADVPSVALLSQLAPALPGLPLLVLATWREDEADRAALGTLLPSLGRHARAVGLEALAVDELARMVGALCGATPDAAVVAALYARSGGNPLFAGQLAQLLRAEGADLTRGETARRVDGLAPRGIQELIRGRLDRLASPVRRALQLGAAVGREVELDLLERVWETLESGVLPSFVEARAAGLLRDRASAVAQRSALEFAHVLVRDVLDREIPPAERAAVHRAIGEALLATRDPRDDAVLSAVAHHFVAAGASREARVWAERAGERALRRHGQADAVRCFEAALDCLTRDPDAGDGRDRARLALRLGLARWQAGQPEAARACFREAFAGGRATGDAEIAAAAAIGWAGRTDLTLGPEEEAVRMLEEALEGLGAEPSRLRAELLARLSTALYFGGDPAKRERVSREAVSCAEALDDPAALTFALSARHYVLYRPGTLAERRRLARRQLETARAADDPDATAQAHFHCMIDGFEAGDFGEVEEQLGAYAALARRLGRPFLLWQESAFGATLALARGRLKEAERLSHEALALGREIASPNALPLHAAQLYALRGHQGRLAELEPLLGELGESFPRMPAFAFARAEASLALGAHAEARAFFRAAAEGGGLAIPHDFNWGAIASIAARVCVALGETELAEPLFDQLLPASGTCFVLGIANVWDGAVDLALGELATLLGRLEEAEAYLAEAEALHARLGARAHLARTWRAQAKLAERRGAADDAARAAALRRQTRELAGELGLGGLERETTGGADATGADRDRPGEEARLARTAEGWTLRFDGREVSVGGGRGMTYLAALLARPGQPMHVLDLVALHVPADAPRPGGVDAGELLDARGRREVRERIRELTAALETAEAEHDLARSEGLRHELETLEETLAAALGLGGRARRTGDPVERARKSVYNRIRDALAKIEAVHAELGRHLRHAVRTGRTCAYAPERPLDWQVE